MGKKKANDSTAPTKGKPNVVAKDRKKEKMYVSAMLASMDQIPDKPKKGSTSSSASVSKSKPKPTPKQSSSYADMDLPPSNDEDYDSETEELNDKKASQRADLKPFEVSISDKELRKRKEKKQLAAHVTEQAKKEALRDDRDAFTVVIGSKTSILEGDNDADANVKDITVETSIHAILFPIQHPLGVALLDSGNG